MADKGQGPAQRGRAVGSRRSTSARVAEKIQQKIRDKEYYEAHQTYRALYQRFKAQSKESDALDLLYNGTLLLLEHHQWSSGTDLGMLLISHLKEKKTPVSKEWLDKIGKILSLYEVTSESGHSDCIPGPSHDDTTSPPHDHSPSHSHNPGPSGVFQVVPDVDSRETLLRAALKWTTLVGEEKWQYGHPELHKMAAMTYWKEKQYTQARDHFLYAEDPQQFGVMLVELATSKGYRGEADLFIAQAVLQLLVLKNRAGGLAVFNSYTRRHPQFKAENPPYVRHPLLNFIWFLLSACKDRNREVFDCLMTNYAVCIDRDPSFQEYLEKVGVVFFRPPTHLQGSAVPGPQGIFGVGGAGGLLEGIINSISNIFPPPGGPLPPGGPNFPQTATTTTSSGSSTQGSQNVFSLSSGGTVTHEVGPIRFGPGGEISQMQQIHMDQVPIRPAAGVGPPGSFQLNISPGGLPFRFPRAPGTIPTVSSGGNSNPRGAQTGVQTAPSQAAGVHFTSPPSAAPQPPPVNIRFTAPNVVNIRPPQGGIRVGGPQPAQISVVGFRMEGIPLHTMGIPSTGFNEPRITPEQQQLYQQHAQQAPPPSEDPNTSTEENQDMELD